MSTAKASENRVIQLDARNEQGIVTVTPQDKDRFVLRVGEAIEACQRAKADELTRERFDFLLKRFAAWILDRSDLRDAFLTIRDGSFCFIAVRSSAAYDAAFEDALSELDFDLAHDRDIQFRVEVMSLPPVSERSMRSFLNADLTLRFQGGKRS